MLIVLRASGVLLELCEWLEHEICIVSGIPCLRPVQLPEQARDAAIRKWFIQKNRDRVCKQPPTFLLIHVTIRTSAELPRHTRDLRK